jgi:hypothetical protein
MRHVTELWDSEAQNNNLLIPAAEATEKAEHCNGFVSYRKSPRRAQFILIKFSAHQVKKRKGWEIRMLSTPCGRISPNFSVI